MTHRPCSIACTFPRLPALRRNAWRALLPSMRAQCPLCNPRPLPHLLWMSTVRPLWLPSRQPMTTGAGPRGLGAEVEPEPGTLAFVRVWWSEMLISTSCGEEDGGGLGGRRQGAHPHVCKPSGVSFEYSWFYIQLDRLLTVGLVSQKSRDLRSTFTGDHKLCLPRLTGCSFHSNPDVL